MPGIAPAPLTTTPSVPASDPSIVDYLNSQGKDSSFGARTTLAGQYGIQGYTGTADQNTTLLGYLRAGKQPGVPAAAAPGSSPAVSAAPISPAAPSSVPTDNSSLSPEDKVAQSLGFNSYEDAINQLTAAPSQDTTDFYNQAYTAAGLDKLAAQIASKQNDLATATDNINENPWLDEANRVGKIKNLQDLANADIKNLQDQYNTGLKSVETTVSNHAKDLASTAAANKAKLAALEAQAKEAATTAKTSTAAPKTIKAADGATYQWNNATQSFDQILPPKASTPGKNGTPVPPASPTGTGPQFNSFNFTAKQIGDLNAAGLPQDAANNVLAGIKQGLTLEQLRQDMQAAGYDPKLLDQVMLYVDPAHNTPAPKAKSSSAPASAPSSIPGISLNGGLPSIA